MQIITVLEYVLVNSKMPMEEGSNYSWWGGDVK